MKFERIEMKNGEGNGSGDFLKLADGDSVTGVLRGELFKFWQIWPQGGQKQILTAPAAGATLRFRANFVVVDGKTLTPKVWEFGSMVNNMLYEYGQECELDKSRIKITRRGSGKNNTQYIVVVLGPVSAQGLASLEKVQLHILDGDSKRADEPKDEEPPF